MPEEEIIQLGLAIAWYLLAIAITIMSALFIPSPWGVYVLLWLCLGFCSIAMGHT